MARKKSRVKGKGSCSSTLLSFTFKILVLLLLLPVLQVGCSKLIDPPYTPMMGQRWLEAKLDDRAPEPIRHEWLDLEDVPDNFLRLVLVAEDARFFKHNGFDMIELEAAWKEYAEEGKPLRGASTVTMQCARSVYLWQGRSYIRKALEAYYTVLMEKMLGKRRILELYVNHIEMGDGIYGLQAASQTHFRQPASELNRTQLATLASMLPNPRNWDPAKPEGELLTRRERTLQRVKRFELPESY